MYELPAGARDSDMAFRLAASIPCDNNSRCLVVLGDSVAICQACAEVLMQPCQQLAYCVGVKLTQVV